MIQYDVKTIIKTLKSLGYKIYDKPYQLNIVGIRVTEEPNKFNDPIIVFYKDDNGKWIFKQYKGTTDPGTYWLKSPMNNLGTALLKEGQWIDAWKIGMHKGKYSALTQQKPVTVYRDYDRDAVFDFDQKTSTGLYGINIHKAGANSSEVDKWSAGCQVFSKSADFEEFMNMANKHKSLYGNNFTYTLIDERAVKKRNRRWWLYGGLALIGLWVGYRYYKTKKLPSYKEPVEAVKSAVQKVIK